MHKIKWLDREPHIQNVKMVKTKVTRKEVAEQAGVSVSVVSRALNNSGYVDKEKKQQILAIAEKLGYVPNPVAMSLQQSRTRQIIFYCKDLTNAFNMDMYFGMQEAAREQDYVVLINGDMEFGNIKGMITDGIILQNEFFAAEYVSLYGKNYLLPVVSASFGSAQRMAVAVPMVEWDLYESMELALSYLRKRGHRKIAYASPYPYNHCDGRTNAWKSEMDVVLGDRMQDFFICEQETQEQDDLSDAERSIRRVLQNERFLEKGKEAGVVFLERNLDATAVICFNDEFAIGFVSHLEAEGKKIPGDISILSFDGTVRRKTMTPEITSITPNPKEMGRNLASLLMDRIDGKKIRYCSKQSIQVAEGASVKTV